jgi:hypothetical protein
LNLKRGEFDVMKIKKLFDVLITLEESERNVIIESLDPVSSYLLHEFTMGGGLFKKEDDPPQEKDDPPKKGGAFADAFRKTVSGVADKVKAGEPITGADFGEKGAELQRAINRPIVKAMLDSDAYKKTINKDSLNFGAKAAAGGVALGAGAAVTQWFVERLKLHKKYKNCDSKDCRDKVSRDIQALKEKAKNNGIKLTLAGALVGAAMGVGRRGQHAYRDFKTRREYGI